MSMVTTTIISPAPAAPTQASTPSTPSSRQIPTEFCFPLRPDSSDPASNASSPSRRGFHSRQYTGIEIPVAIKPADLTPTATTPQFASFHDFSFDEPATTESAPSAKSPHRRHAHRRSAAISVDFKMTNPGLALGASSSPSSIPQSASSPSLTVFPPAPSNAYSPSYTMASSSSTLASGASVSSLEQTPRSLNTYSSKSSLSSIEKSAPSFASSSASSLPLKSAASQQQRSSLEPGSGSSKSSPKQHMRVQFVDDVAPASIPPKNQNIKYFAPNHVTFAAPPPSPPPQEEEPLAQLQDSALPSLIVTTPTTDDYASDNDSSSHTSSTVRNDDTLCATRTAASIASTNSLKHPSNGAADNKSSKRHKKVKSWAGSILRFRKSKEPLCEVPAPAPKDIPTDAVVYNDVTPQQEDVLDAEPASAPTEFFDSSFASLSPDPEDDMTDLILTGPPESLPFYNDSNLRYSSSYIDSSQLGSNNNSPSLSTFQHYGVGQDVNMFDDDSLIDLDAALGPLRTPGLGSSFKTSPFPHEISHRRTESAPEASFSEFKAGFLNNNARRSNFLTNKHQLGGSSIIEEEEDQSAVASDETEDAMLMSLAKSGRSGSLGQHMEASNSSLSLTSASSGNSGASAVSRSRDRARVARNYNSLSINAGSLLALGSPLVSSSSLNRSTSSLVSEQSSAASAVATTPVTPAPVEEESYIAATVGTPTGRAFHPDLYDDNSPRVTNKTLNRLSSTTNDTLTPILSGPPYTPPQHTDAKLPQEPMKEQDPFVEAPVTVIATPPTPPSLDKKKTSSLLSLRSRKSSLPSAGTPTKSNKGTSLEALASPITTAAPAKSHKKQHHRSLFLSSGSHLHLHHHDAHKMAGSFSHPPGVSDARSLNGFKTSESSSNLSIRSLGLPPRADCSGHKPSSRSSRVWSWVVGRK